MPAVSVISGASGFIGGYLMERLEHLQHKVIPIPRAFLFKEKDLKEFLRLNEPNYIFHLASYGNHSYQISEEEIVKTNIMGTFNLLEASKNIPYKAFINFGSSSEYGKKERAMSEYDLPEADTFYGVTKVAGTYLACAFATQFKKPIVTIRPFSVYGPGEADFRFVPTIIRCLIKQKTLFLANAVHDWIYIDDFLEGLLKVMENISLLPGEIINIGTGQQFSNEEIVGIIENFTGQKIEKKYISCLRSYDSMNWQANNYKLKQLGWEQKYTIEAGLKKTYEYYKQRFEA